VAHQSSDAERARSPDPRVIKADRDDFYTVDVRGIGESRPDTCDENSFFELYGSDYFYAIHSIMLDRPYVGQKTHDVLRVLDWLGGIGYDEVHIVAKGWGALPATAPVSRPGQTGDAETPDLTRDRRIDGLPLLAASPNILSVRPADVTRPQQEPAPNRPGPGINRLPINSDFAAPCKRHGVGILMGTRP
jgi:hypothetical protein